MPWGSDKQIAFFKRMADRYALCGTADVFDLEIERGAHKARMSRAVLAAKRKRERLSRKRARRKDDRYAHTHGFKSFAEMWDNGYVPGKTKAARRKAKKKPVRAKGSAKVSRYAKENPFKRHQDNFVPVS